MRLIAVAAAALLALGACGDDDDAASTTGEAASTAAATETESTDAAATDAAGTAAADGGDPDIVIVGFAFPEEIRVAAGAPITVRNDDNAEHTVTALDGAFNVTVGGGGTATIDPLEPGTYDFVCNFHGGMDGTLIVE